MGALCKIDENGDCCVYEHKPKLSTIDNDPANDIIMWALPDNYNQTGWEIIKNGITIPENIDWKETLINL